MKTIILLCLFSMSFGQKNIYKSFYEKTYYFLSTKYDKYDNLGSLNLEISKKDSTEYYSHINLNYSEKLSDQFKYFISGNISSTNISQSLYNNSYFEYKKYFDTQFYVDEAYFNYSSDKLSIDIGRIIDKVGTAPFESLFIGNHDYHDGYRLNYKYKEVIFSTRYYELTPYKNNTRVNRYLVQHGISVNLLNNTLNLQLHESALIAGTDRSIPLVYLNPLIPYYANQVNNNYVANIHYTFLSHFQYYKKSAIWLEFFLDDFQTDSESSGNENKEPTEFGLQLGMDYSYSDHHFLTNLTIIRNRTYNDNDLIDGKSYSKFIDHGKIIGYKYGSNLINFEFLYQFHFNSESIISFNVFNRNYGDESVFSKFDLDTYLNYDQGYFEPIPFGNLLNELSLKISYFKRWTNLLGDIGISVNRDNIGKSIIAPFLNIRYELD